MLPENLMLMQMPLKPYDSEDQNVLTPHLVFFILRNASLFRWSIRGSGRVIRLDIDNNVCLHIWKPELAIEGVSIMHDHPWNLTSFVVCGELRNKKYVEIESNRKTHVASKINCGFEGGLTGDRRLCSLKLLAEETITAGGIYTQKFNEIHETDAKDGTVTIVYRDYVPGFVPTVYWPTWSPVIDNQPRVASLEEVLIFVNSATKMLQQPT